MNASLQQPVVENMMESEEKAPSLNVPSISLPNWLKHAVYSLITVFLILLGLDRLYHPANFQIEEVSVFGDLKNIHTETIVGSMQNGVNGNFFSLDLEDMREHIKTLPWVYDVSMRRVWPSSLQVTIQEVEPIARWGDEHWMHESGELVPRVEDADDEILPMLSGPDAMRKKIWERYYDWQNIFAKYGVELNSLHFDERELWRMTLSADYMQGLVNDAEAEGQTTISHEVDLVIPIENDLEKVRRFVVALQDDFLSQFLQIEKVDLRYPNGFAIAWDETREIQQQIDAEVDAESVKENDQ